MPENDFEKQAQQLLEGLKLKPSQEVWSKVEERIKKDKRRRRFIIWLPLMALLLGAGGYWFAQNNGSSIHSTSLTATKSQAPSTGHTQTKPTESITQDNNADVKESKHDQQPVSPVLPGEAEKSNKAVADTKESINKNNSTPLQESDDKRTLSKAETTSLKDIAAINTPSKNNKPVVLKKKAGVIENRNIKDKTYLTSARQNKFKKVVEEKIPTDNIQEVVSIYQLPLKPELQTIDPNNTLLPEIDGERALQSTSSAQSKMIALEAPQEKPTIKLAKKKTWEWGVNAGAGVSKVGNGVSDIFKVGSSEKAVSYFSPSGGFSNVGNLVSQNSVYPVALPAAASTIKPGVAWNAGVFGKWYFKNRLALTTGLGYSYFSNSRKVGYIASYNTITSSVDANTRFAPYYGGSYSNEYTNKYHFIEMPIGIQWQINKGIKLPLQLDAGITISWLANTNALHYNEDYGTYYEDKSLFNKVQTGLYAGITAKLFQHSKRPLYIGPVFQYNLSNIVKSSAGTPQNFMYGGIKAGWVLWKK